MAHRDSIVVGLDVGTSQTKVVIAEAVDGELNILGVGQSRTRGTRGGAIVNVGHVTEGVEKAISDAEMMSGTEVRRVNVALSGGVLRSINRSGMAPVRKGAVTEREVAEVRRTATALPLAADERVLAVVPQGYAVDETNGVSDPRGMAATCLYGRYHVVTVSDQGARNLQRVCEKLELSVEQVYLEPLASAASVLDVDEQELGVLLLDIGSETTTIAVYRDGILLYTGLVPAGGWQLTSDLARGLKTPTGEAERLKLSHGCASATSLQEGEIFEVPGLGGRPPKMLPREAMVELIEPRAEDLLIAAARKLESAGFRAEDLASGVVLCGGTAALDGFVELAEDVLGMPARCGVPRGVGGLSKVVERPSFSAAVGLTLLASQRDEGRPGERRQKGVVRRMWRRFREIAEVYL